jgi:hypothetical protein
MAHDNILYSNFGHAIKIFATSSTTNSKVFNNVCYQGAQTCVTIDGGSGARVINNISYLNSGGNFSNSGSGTVLSNNVTANPLFVNPAALDFQLQAGSPAINAGLNLFACGLTIDFHGFARPTGGGTCAIPTGAAWEVGPHEFGVGVDLPPAAPTGVTIT